MRVSRLVVFMGLLLCLWGAPSLSEATHISPPLDSKVYFQVWNGSTGAWVNVFTPFETCPNMPCPSFGTATVPNDTVPIGGTNTITIAGYTAGTTAKILWDNTQRWLWLRNIKITSATAITELKFRMWYRFPTAVNDVGAMNFQEQGGGWLKRAPNGASANGAKIFIRGSIESAAGSPTVENTINNLPDPPVACTNDKLIKCATATSSTIFWSNWENESIALSQPDHIITIYFWLTLPHSAAGSGQKDFLQLPDTATGGIRIQGTSPGGGGVVTNKCDTCQGEECATCQDCDGCPNCLPDGCVPKQSVSSVCMTTFSSSSAKDFGCPTCIREDGLVAQSGKVTIFARANWGSLSQDMAQGRGEHLSSLAILLAVPSDYMSEFFAMAQDYYREHVESSLPSPDVVVGGLVKRMSSHPVLRAMVSGGK